MHCSAALLRATKLVTLLDAVGSRRVQLGPEDIYRVCALLKAKEDPLELQTNSAFLRGLRTQYDQIDADTVTPFQRSFIDGTFGALQVFETDILKGSNLSTFPSSRQDLTVQTSTTILDGEPTIEARLAAVWEVVNDCKSSAFVSGDAMRRLQQHCKAFELCLRKMKPHEVASLVKALAVINYQDYTFTNLLTRRSCEVASKLTPQELCRTYFNLSKLQSHDSMVAFVNQIESRIESLSCEHVFSVASALERQPQIASAPARMVPRLVARAVTHLPETDSAAYHRALLVVMARYNLNRHAATAAIVKDAARHEDGITPRDLLAMLQALAALGVAASSDGFAALIHRAEVLAAGMDIRNVDALMDTLSVLPVDTTAVMATLMQRLATDAGRLLVPQVVHLLDLLSSYPPARGEACIAALALAASLRADSFDAGALERVVLNLAQLQHFSDDFYALVEVLQRVKGGFRSFERLVELLKCCTKDVITDVRGQEMITKGILGLAPSLNDEELAEARRLLVQLGVNDKNVHQMIFRRAKQLQRESGGRFSKRRYDDDFI